MTQQSNEPLDLDAALAIVRRRTPGVLERSGSSIINLDVSAFTFELHASGDGPLYNNLEAIVTAVNAFEQVAERCKRAEAEVEKQVHDRIGHLVEQTARYGEEVAELTRQRDELLSVLRNIADKDDYAADDPHGCLDCIIGIAKASVKGMADGKA